MSRIPWIALTLLALACGSSGPDDNTADSPDAPRSGGTGSFNPTVFYACYDSKNYECTAIGGTVPGNYNAGDGQSACTGGGGQLIAACPAAGFIGACETDDKATQYYVFYYHRNDISDGSFKYACQTALATWHDP